MPKIDIGKEWCERMARLEPDNGEIGAGPPDPMEAHLNEHTRAALEDGTPPLLERLGRYGTSGATSIEIVKAIKERDAEIARLRALLRVVHLDWAIHQSLSPYAVEQVEAAQRAGSRAGGAEENNEGDRLDDSGIYGDGGPAMIPR